MNTFDQDEFLCIIAAAAIYFSAFKQIETWKLTEPVAHFLLEAST
jgi:hypothetical protein